MKHRWISLLLVLVMALSLFPAAAFAADGEETSNVNPATGREAGPAGDQRVALMVYGKSVTDSTSSRKSVRRSFSKSRRLVLATRVPGKSWCSLSKISSKPL